MGWERVRGHAAVLEQLAAADSRGRLAHAYLFVGPAGVGKRTFAVELARALLCERPPARLTACGKCPACAQVAADTHPDFFTARKPDDKQEFPVELMREVRDQLGRRPVRGPRKVGVIADADEFNDESANCFLKTLEEPPPGAVLVLLATTTESLLPTILSRCQVVRFRPLNPGDLRAVLADHAIADAERVGQLVRLANGSPGQALALADPAVWTLRSELIRLFAAADPDPAAVAAALAKFAEDAGKESAAQRRRAAAAVRLVLDLLQRALRAAVGEPPDGDDAAAVRRLAAAGPDHLADLIDAAVTADYWIDRRVQLPLVAESLADKLCHRPAGVA